MNAFQSKQRAAKGFTLMELLVVVSIMVILAGLTMGAMSYVNQKQARETAKVQLGLLELGIENYKADEGHYPFKEGSRNAFTGRKSTADLQYELCPPPNAKDSETGRKKKVYVPELDPENDTQGWLSGTRVGNIEILDPWGTPYNYKTNNPSRSRSQTINPGYDLWSSGPDGETNFRQDNYDPKDPKNVDDVRLW